MWEKRWQRFKVWDYHIRESLDIQLSLDLLYSSRRKILLPRSGRIGLPWQWMLVKEITMNKALIIRAMNLWMFIWKAGLYVDVARHSGINLKTELESLYLMSRGDQRPPTAMLQASDWPTKWGKIGMRRLIGRFQNNSVEDYRSWRRCWRSLAVDQLIWTELCGLHDAQRMRFIEEKDFARRMCMWMNHDRKSWRCMERWFSMGRIWARWQIFPRILARIWTLWEYFISHYDDCRRSRI